MKQINMKMTKMIRQIGMITISMSSNIFFVNHQRKQQTQRNDSTSKEGICFYTFLFLPFQDLETEKVLFLPFCLFLLDFHQMEKVNFLSFCLCLLDLQTKKVNFLSFCLFSVGFADGEGHRHGWLIKVDQEASHVP